MILGLAAVPLASADDLKDRKHRVQGHINKVEKHLDQSSDRLVRTTRALRAAEAKLRVAEGELAKAQGQLAAAEVVDRRMQAALDAAVRDLERARADLAEGNREMREQQKLLSRIAVRNYQMGDPSMLGLSMVLTSTDPAELTSQLHSVKNVMDKEAVALDRLEASKVLLTVQEEQVEAAKKAVAIRRAEAAENLERKQVLEAQAQSAQQKVSDLVAVREEARKDAAEAKAEDQRRLHQLKRERTKIEKMLKKRAIAARKRARAKARAEARAQAKAHAQAQSQQHSNNRPGGFLSYPINTYITSPYGMRMHPVYHRWTLHDGTDFGAACGTPIHAAASGTVIARYYNAGYGNRVIIDHGWERGAGLGTAYNHLSRYSTYVGQHVQRGDVIGYVGTTGYSTGCHLHFMVFRNGATVNPMGWL